MSDISPSKAQKTVAANAGYNTGIPAGRLNIKGFRADAAGVVEWIDAEAITHSINALAGEVPPVAGRIAITTNTAVKLTVFL